jgi:tripartite ATP-independent transporter DctP family solute receptor
LPGATIFTAGAIPRKTLRRSLEWRQIIAIAAVQQAAPAELCDEEDVQPKRNDFRPAVVFHTLHECKPHSGCAHAPATGAEPQREGRRMKRRSFLAGIGATTAAATLGMPSILRAQAPITLNGAVQFNDDHAFNRALIRFEELVKKYYGKPVNFTLHKNSSLGLEKQYFEYMSQGKAVDYGIVSPAHMSTFAKAAPFIDAPFVFKGIDHMNKVVEANILAPIADEVAAKAEVVLIGYAGGGIRNIFANKPLKNLADLKGLKVRVQGAPIWSKTFAAVGMSPTVIAYNEIYNAIQNGVISAGENEAAGVEAMKFYEVAPHLNLTQHAVSIRPICFSVKTLKTLPKDLQDAIMKAGKEAGDYGRQLESSEEVVKLDTLEKAGKLKRVPFEERDAMKKLADPVMATYAKEIGAEAIFEKINVV